MRGNETTTGNRKNNTGLTIQNNVHNSHVIQNQFGSIRKPETVGSSF